jgi:hypothetical protein
MDSQEIQPSFFIYDNYQAQNEVASEEELILYFYPSGVSIRKQLFTVTGEFIIS